MIKLYDNFEVDDNDGGRVMSEYDQMLILAELSISTTNDQKIEFWGLSPSEAEGKQRSMFMHCDPCTIDTDSYYPFGLVTNISKNLVRVHREQIYVNYPFHLVP